MSLLLSVFKPFVVKYDIYIFFVLFLGIIKEQFINHWNNKKEGKNKLIEVIGYCI